MLVVTHLYPGNTGIESREDTVEPVGERMLVLSTAGENLNLSAPRLVSASLLWLISQLGERGMDTGLSRPEARGWAGPWLEARDSLWARCALWRYSREGRTHADWEECGLQREMSATRV